MVFQVNLKSVLPGFYQTVKYPTSEGNTPCHAGCCCLYTLNSIYSNMHVQIKSPHAWSSQAAGVRCFNKDIRHHLAWGCTLPAPLRAHWLECIWTSWPDSVHRGCAEVFLLLQGDCYCCQKHPGGSSQKPWRISEVKSLLGSNSIASTCTDEVLKLSAWCQASNLIWDTTKTKESTVDMRRHQSELLHLYVSGDCVERVGSIGFLGTTISVDLSWTETTAAVSKQAHLLFLKVPRKTMWARAKKKKEKKDAIHTH